MLEDKVTVKEINQDSRILRFLHEYSCSEKKGWSDALVDF